MHLRVRLPVLLIVLVLGAGPAQAQEAQEPAPVPRTRFGVMGSRGVGGSPLGDIAERYETFAIAGRNVGVWVFVRPRESLDLYAGYGTESFRIGDQHNRASGERAEYQAHSAMAGILRSRPLGDEVSFVTGADLGVTFYEVSTAAISRSTGELERSDLKGVTASLGFTYGFELPLLHGLPSLLFDALGTRATLIPNARMVANFPDFGGGTGVTRLYGETDLGLKVFFNLGMRVYLR